MRLPALLGALALVVGGAASLAEAATAPAATAATSSGSSAAVELLGGDASTFDHGIGGWTGSESTQLTREKTFTHSGAGALELTAGSSGGTLLALSPAEPATPGDRYTGSAWVSALSGAVRGASGVLVFRTSSGQVTTAAFSRPVDDVVGSWLQTSTVAAVAPTNSSTVAFGVELPGALPGEAHAIDDATLVQTPGAAAAVAGPLSTSGNAIVDGNGQPVVLRGVHRVGLDTSATGAPTDAEIGQIKGWGANFVRVSLGEQFWLPGACAYDPGYRTRVDAVVQSITSRGMVALLDLHSVPSSSCTPTHPDMADYPGAVDFWQDVAARYASNPLVAFDLFNEPHDISSAVWLAGGTLSNGSQVAGMQQLYDAVRSTGARNLVFVSGLDWAAVPPTSQVSGFNIVYAAHAYTCPSAPPPLCASPTPYDPTSILQPWTQLSAAAPVMVTEFGWPDRSDPTYLANVIAFADAQGWGWDAYAFDGTTSGLFDLIGGTAGDGVTIEPSPSGMAVLTGLSANVGGDVPSTTAAGPPGRALAPPSSVRPALRQARGTVADPSTTVWAAHAQAAGPAGTVARPTAVSQPSAAAQLARTPHPQPAGPAPLPLLPLYLRR